jgi:hypothetical protein
VNSPKDVQLEGFAGKAVIGQMVDFMLTMTGPYEARFELAKMIAQIRGHVVTKDNINVMKNGTEFVCDKCGYKILVPQVHQNDKPGVFGSGTELNCPSVKSDTREKTLNDMPLSMLKAALLSVPGNDEKLSDPSYGILEVKSK